MSWLQKCSELFCCKHATDMNGDLFEYEMDSMKVWLCGLCRAELEKCMAARGAKKEPMLLDLAFFGFQKILGYVEGGQLHIYNKVVVVDIL